METRFEQYIPLLTSLTHHSVVDQLWHRPFSSLKNLIPLLPDMSQRKIIEAGGIS